ncbi:hypothetical protein CCHOA_07715 [Corynebacterium choanae]|uniref:Uncharacterized protein n=1 Tax=Corynebacterium choanae TaxID=1862358 RepID=A0A3G6J751_9CORY|nr:hypothetical protein CCHOA_07715 [Corynebacterium choanae]
MANGSEVDLLGVAAVDLPCFRVRNWLIGGGCGCCRRQAVRAPGAAMVCLALDAVF